MPKVKDLNVGLVEDPVHQFSVLESLPCVRVRATSTFIQYVQRERHRHTVKDILTVKVLVRRSPYTRTQGKISKTRSP